MKKVFLFLLGISVLFGTLWGGGVFSRLENTSSQYLSRYDLARGLTQARCEDCLYPPMSWQEMYTSGWLHDVQQEIGYNLDDITLTGTTYEGHDYFMCVARSVDKGYMYGFPKDTSPFCRGMFCGAHLARYSEVVESMYRMIRPHIYKNYRINWFDVGNWISAHQQEIPFSWFGIVKKNLQRCKKDMCSLESVEELDIYVAYCAKNNCNLPHYSNFPANSKLSVMFSLLVKADIIDVAGASSYMMHSFISPEVFSGYQQKLIHLSGCSYDDDYDRDGIKNQDDNCPSTRNPHQYDQDQDTVGNVCDDDIDGDGLVHPVGLVDDENRIIPRMKKESDDICPFLPDNDQQQTCNTGSAVSALDISSTPSFGIVPLRVDFSQQYAGTLDTLSWDFGDKTSYLGLDPTHTYTQVGKYVVKAKALMGDEQVVVAKLPIEVFPGIDVQVGCEGKVDKLAGNVGEIFTFSSVYTGAVDKMIWSWSNDMITLSPDTTIQKKFTKPGFHRAELQCYNARGEWVGLSSLWVETRASGLGSLDDLKGSSLTASSLSPPLGKSFDIDTVYHGFVGADIESITRDFGDGDVRTNTDLHTKKVYTQPGAYVIKQVISFKHTNEELENMLTVYVKDEYLGEGTSLSVSSLTGNKGDDFDFQLHLENIDIDDVNLVQRDCNNGSLENISKNIADHLLYTCVYMTPGSHRVKAYLYKNDKKIFINELTVYVSGEDICDAHMNSLHCDLDKDGIPDLCDDDIDGDGIPNQLGLLMYETDDCNFEDNRDKERSDIYHGICKKGAHFDNCPFIQNKDQQDDNANGWGNVCDTRGDTDTGDDGEAPGDGGKDVGNGDAGDGDSNGGDGTGDLGNDNSGDGGEDTGNGNIDSGNEDDNIGDGEQDSDGDGIPDASDACASLPESNNGSEDGDGCPEFPDTDDSDTGNDKNNDQPFIKVENCTSCPCPYADYASALWKGDRVRALLLDPEETVVYRYTEPKIIKEDILEQMR